MIKSGSYCTLLCADISLEDEEASIYTDVTPTGDADTKAQARLKEFRESLASRINEINVQV